MEPPLLPTAPALPSGPEAQDVDAYQDNQAHDKPAHLPIDREAIRSIFEDILNRSLVALHRNSKPIPKLHGVLENVISRLRQVEASDRLERATEQQQSIAQVLDSLCSNGNAVMVNL